MRAGRSVARPQGTLPLLDVRQLTVDLAGAQSIRAVDDVSFTVDKGEFFGIVGESGSGKSMTCRAILGLLPTTTERVSGSVNFSGSWSSNMLGAPASAYRAHVWGVKASLVPQDPMSSLDPVRRIGVQVGEAVAARRRVPRRAREKRVFELLDEVGVTPAPKRATSFPHELSGGLRQRVLIACALAGSPDLLFADEPTTALDVITQREILDLLALLRRERQMSVVLISHDLSVVGEVCDRVAVMYSGQIVELGTVAQVLTRPRHPYTLGLIASLPSGGRGRVTSIPGVPAVASDHTVGCRFAGRCPIANDECLIGDVELMDISGAPGHSVRCRRTDLIADGTTWSQL